MYKLKVVNHDFKSFEVELHDSEIDDIFKAIYENQVYFNAEKSGGIYIPLHTIRYIYFIKKEEPCQEKNQSLEVEKDLNSLKENSLPKELAILQD